MEQDQINTPKSKSNILGQLQVSTFPTIGVKNLKCLLQSKQDTFTAGCISSCLETWQCLTNDPEILQMVSGMHIEFANAPFQVKVVQSTISSKNIEFVDKEISSLLTKKVIVPCHKSHDDFVSPIFLRAKKDGSFRMVLNLKSFNKFVKYNHFKMDTIYTAINMMKPHCYMASVDLKDAYYSVPIHKNDQKYLKFLWKDTYYRFTAFPNGLALCPRKFTKLLKPVYAWLRNKGHLSVAYIDDSYLQADTYDNCVKNIIDTVTLFDRLGFVVHPTKSVFTPAKTIKFLGFMLDSINMKVYLTQDRADSIKSVCNTFLSSTCPTIRQLAQLLGKITSSFPGAMFGPLYYRNLDMNKTKALKEAKGNFDQVIKLSPDAVAEIQWWTTNVSHLFNKIDHGNPQTILYSDASKIGWGCSCNGIKSGGNWTPGEAQFHINYLEMLAAYFALKAFTTDIAHKHVKLMVDNTTVVTCINNMGTSHSIDINKLTKTIWLFCIDNNIWLTTAHIAGKYNTEADSESRKDRKETEWSLKRDIFLEAIKIMNIKPNMDLFASRLNYKIRPYASFTPDPEASVINAFSISWEKYTFYAFPPFCLILRTLQKIWHDKATGIIIVPCWPTQPWWPYLTEMLIDHPLLLPRMTDTITLPSDPTRIHPLHKKLQLIMCLLSGDCCKTKEFQKLLQTSLETPGEWEQKSNTAHTLPGGKNTAVQGTLIHFQKM